MMIDHHTKYLELHGVDETVEMTRSEHKLLHNRLRQEGKCDVPPDELAKISMAAYQRGSKHKAYRKKYNAEHKTENNAACRKYNAEHRDEINAYNRKYNAEHRDEINAYQRAYHAEHRDHVNAGQRERYAARKLGVTE